uniref:Tetratricopeptide repeat protein n=1 Tax=Pseudomonas aeruginosa TaxID=287 RepID=A0A5E5RBA4_PSEAI|nr:hypothetical protein TUEID40_05810 [Pseudomonas aeruginosa]
MSNPPGPGGGAGWKPPQAALAGGFRQPAGRGAGAGAGQPQRAGRRRAPGPPRSGVQRCALRDGVARAAAAKRAMRAPAAPAPLSGEMSEPRPCWPATHRPGGAATDGRGRAGAPAALADRPPAQAAQQAKVQAALAGDFVAQARGKAVAVKPEVLDEALGAVLALREQGKTEQAATQLAELQKRFPGENLVERLERLATIAASARKRP